MLTTILTWLAKFLINYFLKTSQELKVTLESAVRASESLRKEVDEQRELNVAKYFALQEMKANTIVMEQDLLEVKKKYETLQKERNLANDSLTDGAVIRGTI